VRNQKRARSMLRTRKHTYRAHCNQLHNSQTMTDYQDRHRRLTIADPATDTEAHAIGLALHVALEGIRLARKALVTTRISDDAVKAKRALDDAQKVLERAVPPKSE
jgi:hypothetical protein